MAPEFGGPVIVSREPGVVSELRPFNTCSYQFWLQKPKSVFKQDLCLTSRVPWAPQEGGGMVSGRGGELGPDFWKFKSHALNWFSTSEFVVTGDSDELLGPDAGMFAYNGSEFASWQWKYLILMVSYTNYTNSVKMGGGSHHILLGCLVKSLVAGQLLAGWQTRVELYLLHLNQVAIRSTRLINLN